MTDLAGIDVDAAIGTIVGVRIAGTPVAVVRYAEGWSMFPDSCPHARCSFVEDGGEVADGTTLICACHGSEFDLRTGRVLQGPATSGLDLTPLRTDAGRLVAEAEPP